MANKKTARRALFSSVLALILCCCMLVGTTFAWFTDSVTSANNIIKSGTLDVTMEWMEGTEDPATGTWTDASTGAIFNYDLWEPGYTEVRHIKIANVGNLALKYQVQIVANGEVSDLADVIDVYYVDPAKQIDERADLTNVAPMGTLSKALEDMSATANGNLLPKDANNSGEVTLTIALKMQETAGNEYQNKSIGSDFSIVLLATQYTHEEDSFDDQYDAGAEFAADAFAIDPASLKDAIANADEGDVVVLVKDIDMGGEKLTVAKDVVLDLNGYTLSGTCNAGQSHLIMVNNGAALDIVDGSSAKTGKITYAQGTSNTGWAIDLEGELNLNGGTIELTGDAWDIAYCVDIRPNAWGTAYTEPTVFTMNGGKLASSFDAIRVASSSSDSYADIAASFVMNGGEVVAERDGIFMQQSNGAYDTLSVAINDGTVKGTRPIRVYGPDATSVNAGTAKPMTITAKNDSLVLVGELDSDYDWHTAGKIAYRTMSLNNLNTYATITLN